MQKIKAKDRRKQPCGVATFWKTDKLHLAEHRSGSRSLGTRFRRQNAVVGDECCDVVVVNVHLESSQSRDGADKRARQLNSALAWASRVIATPEVTPTMMVVCGDFNAGTKSPLLQTLKTEPWHGHDLCSSYDHPAAAKTLPASRATYVVPHVHYVIDHLLYSHKTTTLQAVLDPLTPSEIDEHLGGGEYCCSEKGFPSEFCPSDHLPVGAVFGIRHPREERQEEHTVA